MPGESQVVPHTGAPDPTVLTTEALARGLGAERDYTDAQFAVRDERLRGIDVATKLLNETVNRVPTDVQKEVSHLRELAFERIESLSREINSLSATITLQFSERDTRSEREARDNTKAVDAAFAAQKESAAQQNEANSKAIAKSEAQTSEAIAKLGELFRSTTDAIAAQILDAKDTVNALALDLKNTRSENRGGEAGKAAMWAAVVGGVGLVALLLGIAISVMNLAAR